MWAVGLIIGAVVAGAYSAWLAPRGAILGWSQAPSPAR